jgi:putative oxidoreductase
MKPNLFSTHPQPTSIDLAVLLMRVVCGIAFIIHGSVKIGHPFNWMGEHSGYAGIFQCLAAIAEFCGGMALILGFLTRIAAFGICCTMAVALYVLYFKMGVPFVDLKGGMSYELPAMLFVISFFLMIAGPGRFSVDSLLFRRKPAIQ